jgi:hypothetical protein
LIIQLLESENQRLKARLQSLKTASEQHEREMAQLREHFASELEAATQLATQTAARLALETAQRETAEQAQYFTQPPTTKKK